MSEAAMKAALDGWFFTYDHHRERVRACKVPVDFIPDHKPAYMVDVDEPHINGHRWTPSEDETIFVLRNAGTKWLDIAKKLKLAQTTVCKRYLEICVMRGVQPVDNEATRSRRFSPETCRKVIEMRLSGLPFRELAPQLGLTITQANHIFIRWQKRQQAREAA